MQQTGERVAATKWSRIERKIGSAASDHACGVQATAGEGHRRSLCSPEAPLAEVGWGGQLAMKVQNLRKLLSLAERPATGLNLPQISFNAEATQISKRICRNSGRGQRATRWRSILWVRPLARQDRACSEHLEC